MYRFESSASCVWSARWVCTGASKNPQHPPVSSFTGLHRPRPLGGDSPPQSWARGVDTYDWRAAASTLVDFVLTASFCMHRRDYPSTRTKLHATTLQHTLTHSTRHVSTLDKIVSKYSSQSHAPITESISCMRSSVRVPSVNSQPWRCTNNSLGLPPTHSLCVCLFL